MVKRLGFEKMKVKVCIGILALLALIVRESDGFVKSGQKESEKGSLVEAIEEVKTSKFNKSDTEDSNQPQNSKHKRGIFHYGGYGTGVGWPSQYASVYGYNLHLPPQGVHVGRGIQSGIHNHHALHGLHGYPVAHGIPTGYGLPAVNGLHGYHGVQPLHGIQTLHGIHPAHGLQPYHGVPSVHTLQADHGVHALSPHQHVSHGIPSIHGVQPSVTSVPNPWQFKALASNNGRPFVLKPGGAVVSSFNVNYPQQHHQHIPTGVVYPPVTSVATPIPVTPVAAAFPVAPARPAPPIVPAIPVAPVSPQIPVIPSFPSQPNFPLFVQVVPSRPTSTGTITPAVSPSQFFPNVGVLPLEPLQPARPQNPTGGGAEASPQIPSGSQPPLPQLPPSPTQQPWRPVLNPQFPQHPQIPQQPQLPVHPQTPQQPQLPQQPQQPHQPPTTISTSSDFNRPSITLLPPFVSRPQGGGEALSPRQIPSNNPSSQGYHYGLGNSVQPSLLDGLTDEEIQGAIAQANYQAQLQQNNNLSYQY